MNSDIEKLNSLVDHYIEIDEYIDHLLDRQDKIYNFVKFYLESENEKQYNSQYCNVSLELKISNDVLIKKDIIIKLITLGEEDFIVFDKSTNLTTHILKKYNLLDLYDKYNDTKNKQDKINILNQLLENNEFVKLINIDLDKISQRSIHFLKSKNLLVDTYIFKKFDIIK